MTDEVRARRADARENREAILAAARKAFAQEGVGVPMREIARRAGLGPATVYRHFATKQDLLAAAFADQMARCSTILEDGLADDDPWRGLRVAVERIMVLHALDRGLARAFTDQMRGGPDAAAERAASVGLLRALVERARDAGELRPDVGVDDFVLALMANEGIRAASPERREQSSRRLAVLLLPALRRTDRA